MSDGWYKCDRCGTFEKGPIRWAGRHSNKSTDYANERYRRFEYGHRSGEDDSGGFARTVDLCEECRKELTEWIDDD